MHSNSFMPCSLVIGYKRKIVGWPHSVYSTFSLSMKVILLLCLSLAVIILGRKEPYYIPYNYYDLWMVVGRNSSGQLYFNPTSDSRRVFIWKPYNASIIPTIFYEDYPKILQDEIWTTSSGIPEGTVPPDVSITSPATPEEIKETIPMAYPSGHLSASTPVTASLEIPPPGKGKPKNVTASRPGMNLLQLHQSLKLAELMTTLNQRQAIPDLSVPPPKNGTFESPSPRSDKIVYAKDKIDLTKESSRLYQIRKEKLRAKRQISPDVAIELNLNDAQLNSLQTQVNRRFLTGYDCSNPQEVKPISSCVRDPCEPIEANNQGNYEIADAAQYQIVQYETRREFQGTRCELYISQFTYYCGNADHASPYPQETFYRKPKVLHWDQCKELASLGRYIAGDDKTPIFSLKFKKKTSKIRQKNAQNSGKMPERSLHQYSD